MAIISHVVREVANVVIRQVESSSVASTITPTDTLALSSSTAPPTPDATDGSNGSDQGGTDDGGTSNQSLLFFVALGFGVVFTNLWIIVGVKYCFRYNARRMQEANADNINLDIMPRRRRREKRLMTMDEVNEKFPMMKYKNWVAARAHEGLPTMGGISAPSSRPGSLRDADGVAPELFSKGRVSTSEERPLSRASSGASSRVLSRASAVDVAAAGEEPREGDHQGTDLPEKTMPPTPPSTSTPPAPTLPPRTIGEEEGQPSGDAAGEDRSPPSLERVASEDDADDTEDDHIDAALPPECVGTSGDTCAICIDTLEDDDDVRGLTCGHAFHAVCVDPWLTSRRACCPLCKTDYHNPKPKAVGDNATSGNTNRSSTTAARTGAVGSQTRGSNASLPAPPMTLAGRLRSRFIPPIGPATRPSRLPQSSQAATAAATGGETGADAGTAADPTARTGRSWIHSSRLAPWRRGAANLGIPTAAGALNPAVTPSQLESGARL